jgi:thioester reductase-like protein
MQRRSNVAYFMTGATGFIGRHLLECLLKRKETVYCLVRRPSEDRLQEIALRLHDLGGRVVPVRGDLMKPRLGVNPAQIEDLAGTVDHFFHLAALQDLTADSEALALANVEGTRHALDLASVLDAGCLHYMSTVAVAGHYEGTFTEAMLEQAERLDDPYASTKHDAEAVVRREYAGPLRIYRPSVVVGHSATGEIDKIDGIYPAFRWIQRMRDSLPSWLPRVGIETGTFNVVPVDFVAQAIDHIAHAKDLDGRTFHLVDPRPRKASEIVDELCRAAGVPAFSTYFALPSVPQPLARLLGASSQLPAVQRATDALLAELGIPRRLLGYLGHSTEYACEETRRALAGSGIEVPPFESYAARLWDFWEQNLASMPVRDTRLARAVGEKRVLIAGASGPIQARLARRLAASGATVILLDASAEALEELKAGISRSGGEVATYLADPAADADCADVVARILEAHGGVDVVVCGSGEAPPRTSAGLGALDPAACEAALRRHFLGTIQLLEGVVRGMRERESGQIVLLSLLALDGRSEPAHLAASAALDAFATAMAGDLAGAGIAVTSAHLPPLKPELEHSDAIDAPLGAIEVERAVDVLCDALVHRPRRANTWLGTAAELTRAAAPQSFEFATSLLSRWPSRGSAGS